MRELVREYALKMKLCTEGNVALSAAVLLPLCISVLAIGIDYGHLTLERRQLQSVADLTAIVIASDIAQAEEAALAHLRNNDLNMVLKTAQGWKDPLGGVVPEALLLPTTGRVSFEKGRYTSERAMHVKDRFQPNAQPGDAVRVTVQQVGTLFFASIFMSPPDVSASGTAAIAKAASFSIGSRLASLEGGLINAILGKMLGAELSFTAVDYRSLAAADIDLFKLTMGLATDLNLTAATYNDVLKSKITVPQLLAAVSKYAGFSPGSFGLLTELRRAIPKFHRGNDSGS